MASAYQAMQRAAAGTSTAKACWMGLPMSSVSSSASSSLCWMSSSAKRCSTRLRAAGGWARQRPSSKARRAEPTARSMSAWRPRATAVSTRPSMGERHSKVSSATALTRWPSTSARPSTRPSAIRALARSRQIRAWPVGGGRISDMSRLLGLGLGWGTAPCNGTAPAPTLANQGAPCSAPGPAWHIVDGTPLPLACAACPSEGPFSTGGDGPIRPSEQPRGNAACR